MDIFVVPKFDGTWDEIGWCKSHSGYVSLSCELFRVPQAHLPTCFIFGCHKNSVEVAIDNVIENNMAKLQAI